MIFFIIVTTFAVSLDSFFVGLGLGMRSKVAIKLPALVAVITFLLCVCTCILGEALQNIIESNYVSLIGCTLLLIVGFTTFFRKTDSQLPPSLSLRCCLVASVGVGLDAAVANFSLSLMGYTSLWIPLLFAAAHFITVISGVALANSKYLNSIQNANKFAGVLLIVLGIIKLI